LATIFSGKLFALTGVCRLNDFNGWTLKLAERAFINKFV